MKYLSLFAGRSLQLSAAALLSAAFAFAQNAPIVASEAWVRMPAQSKMDTAMYLTLENTSGQARSVVSVTTMAAAKAEMHEMRIAKTGTKGDGKMSNMGNMPGMVKDTSEMMTMMPVATIDIPAHGKTTLAPGGLHIMLFGLNARPAEGDSFKVTLKLDNGSEVPVSATFRK